MNASEFLTNKGWDRNNPIIGGALFDRMTSIMEEYAVEKKLPVNLNELFPKDEDLKKMADLYHGGEIYVFAGVFQTIKFIRGKLDLK